tara:strand:+ start:272 stop:1099 length:828 start_codon:yes stop_codon:yes gene_type:complete
MLAVSTSPIIARYLNHLSPITIGLWRMMIAALIMSVYGYYKYDLKPINSDNKVKVIAAGILLGIHFALFYGAIALMPNNIANATVFGTMAPLFALFIEIYFGKSISKNLIFGLLIVLLGSSIMFISDFSMNNDLTLGNILAIACSICFAFVFILSDQVRKTDSSFNFSKNVFIYASITLFLIAISRGIPFLSISLNDFIFLFILGVVPTIIGHSVLYYLVNYLRPTIVASIPLGEPFIATIFAWFLFDHQVLNTYIIFGGITTLFGLFIIIQNKK